MDLPPPADVAGGVCTKMCVHPALTPHFQKEWKGEWGPEGAGVQLLTQTVPGLVSHHCLSAANAERACMCLFGQQVSHHLIVESIPFLC